MAFTAAEIQKLTELSDEMAKLIEDVDNTSNEASVIWGQAGRMFARGLARHAAIEAKKTTRATHTTKFQNSRQVRMEKTRNKKNGGSGPAPSASTSNQPGTARNQRSA